MTKRILDVGNCGPDHRSICQLIERLFPGSKVAKADTLDQTLNMLRESSFDLVFINRKLDIDYSDGIEILKQIKADEELAATPVMLVTNYAEHQDTAVAAGAVRGFGKLELATPETRQKLENILAG
ncbi:MAG: response regulator [Planctomycetota bacterium]|nr:response regulator [Planctomycetota bacterium]